MGKIDDFARKKQETILSWRISLSEWKSSIPVIRRMWFCTWTSMTRNHWLLFREIEGQPYRFYIKFLGDLHRSYPPISKNFFRTHLHMLESYGINYNVEVIQVFVDMTYSFTLPFEEERV